ncbi:MAG: DUF1194 domain-containing protein [Alphaproteobacteria bacterium]|nr:DUF1194 domain-containing protein [Alphaproteobacteria bacterium]
MPRRRSLLLGSLAAPFVLGARGSARGQPGSPDRAVDLELILALDVSRSMDAWEQELQMRGYAVALEDPRVVDAITSGPLGAIAVMMFIWSDYHIQETLIPWRVIDSPESAQSFAQAVLEAPRRIYLYTSISGAIDFGARQFGKGYTGSRRVIDISGDGVNNSGRPSGMARDEALTQGIVINGLPIINDRPNPFPMRQPPLDEFYRDHVIGGDGAFMVVAEGFEAFENAIRRKLIREVSGRGDGRGLAERVAPAARPRGG